MSEMKCFCNFSIETPIYDVDLSNKIKNKLNSLDLQFSPEKGYRLTVDFSVENYNEPDFYKFPVEWQQWKREELEKHKNNERKISELIMYELLSQQGHSIRTFLKSLDHHFYTVTVAGVDDFDDVNRVDITIYEEDYSPSKSQQNTICCITIPNVTSTYDNISRAIERIMKNREENKKREMKEEPPHTPNLEGVEDSFLALATAVLKDCPNESLTPEKLSREMMENAKKLLLKQHKSKK